MNKNNNKFSVDYKLIRKVMNFIHSLGDGLDLDSSLCRIYCRILAEATGMPLEQHRLLMEKEISPKHRKDYVLAPEFENKDDQNINDTHTEDILFEISLVKSMRDGIVSFLRRNPQYQIDHQQTVDFYDEQIKRLKSYLPDSKTQNL